MDERIHANSMYFRSHIKVDTQCIKEAAFATTAVHAIKSICGHEGFAVSATRAHAPEGREGEWSETVVPETMD